MCKHNAIPRSFYCALLIAIADIIPHPPAAHNPYFFHQLWETSWKPAAARSVFIFSTWSPSLVSMLRVR